jgi:TRAP-type mannitol/chloroaromatic compound transport system substrate-binding protein
MNMKKLLLALTMPNITQGLANSQGFIGAMPDPSILAQGGTLNNLNSASSAGGFNFTASSAASNTITNLNNNALYQFTVGSAMTLTLDSAYNIAKTLPQPLSVGQLFSFMIMTNAATTIATPTLTSTDVTLAGTTSMLASSLRWYQGAITQVSTSTVMPLTANSTFTSLTQVGSTNHFTVVLGTNALVPVVGTLFHVTVTTGTLPSGWYPIIKVTSATSFVIATPAGTVWTATAGTVDSVVPTTPIYAPLITITGLMANAANMVV